jgi:hypothetical protein
MENTADLPPISTAEIERIRGAAKGTRDTITIGFNILSIPNIDAATNQFDCDLKILVIWKEPDLAHDKDMVSLKRDKKFANGTCAKDFVEENGKFHLDLIKEIDESIYKLEEKPMYQFVNNIDTKSVEKTSVLYLSPNDEAGMVRWVERWQGRFCIQMDLRHFPFDCQELKVLIRLLHRRDVGRTFCCDESRCEMQSYIRVEEWEQFMPSNTCAIDSEGLATCELSMLIRRRSGFYIKNIVAIICALCILSSLGTRVVFLGYFFYYH